MSNTAIQIAFQITFYLLWFPMQTLVVAAILRAGSRRYPFFLAYTGVTLVVAFAEIPASVARFRHIARPEWYSALHSLAQGVIYSLALAVVLNLIYRATADVRPRHVIRLIVTAGSILVAGVSLWVHYVPNVKIALWMIFWTRDLNFCAALLDLLLWSLLLASRHRDQRVLMLAGGMGIMFAGEALGDAFRSLAMHSLILFWLTALFVLAVDLTFLYIWRRAFRLEDGVSTKAHPAVAVGR
jgi:hypothetical protein